MKLAEALVLRADLQKRIAQMRQRLQQSALVQEGNSRLFPLRSPCRRLVVRGYPILLAI